MSTSFGTFVAVLITSALILAVFFWLAARYKYFFHIVPFAVGFAVAAGLSLRVLGLQEFFWWYFILSTVLLSMLLTRHLKSRDSLEAFARLRESALEGVREDEIKEKVARELLPHKQATQHIVGVIVVFAGSLVFAFHAVSYF
ncbi:hypothetical protein [Bradyrhizobium sp. USDA 4520]